MVAVGDRHGFRHIRQIFALCIHQRHRDLATGAAGIRDHEFYFDPRKPGQQRLEALLRVAQIRPRTLPWLGV